MISLITLSKKIKPKYLFSKMVLSVFFIAMGCTVFAQQNVQIDFGKVVKKNVRKGAASANVCWLTDSDKKRPNDKQSFANAIKELGCGSLRFPYGHLADNYLWHTPPYDDTKNGLRPKVASKEEQPYNWKELVNDDGTFKSAMDFDEYMGLCQKLDIKPLVVVNVFSQKYKDGPTADELITAATEWVKYAKRKNYKVAYWQIGNEVDHHRKLLSQDAYVDFYQKITTAMKAADPSIKVGPGILEKSEYFDAIVSKYPNLIDFTSAHQYAWQFIKSCSNYEKWKANTEDYIPVVKEMQDAVSRSKKPDMDIVITETGLSPIGKGMGDINNTYKALWYFNMLMNELTMPNVAYSYFWGTHSPWTGLKDNDAHDVEVLLRVDDNSRKPIGEVVKLVNENLFGNMVKTTTNANFVRSYASINDKKNNCKVFLLNKSNEPQKLILNFNQLPKNIKSLKAKEFKGDSPESIIINTKDLKAISISGNSTEITLSPLSVTILQN
ncbi:hypothetical protein I5M32_13930 [Pedobacter sp. SD-b]|uniref:Alpha-L-arabinofuranosidase 1 catalytic domain-containing protein n=1 Tax=Pedobacter segetis TaxID=2793069 RepID=A0ABS1BMD7_9SPHI|nr:hypothetical protein [Pedobacter segetis]MBK0384064.1 hypothetical protein [Pedobacter segetis]